MTKPKREPNFGPGSISTVAKARKEALLAGAKKPSLMDTLKGYVQGATEGPMSQSAKNLKNRDEAKKKLRD